ncbi:hypothetical protein QYF36_009814 [Acer negundo]|nr:hypothetical protein QYF36_009814 [Acer negundo]
MAMENGLNGETNSNEATTSKSQEVIERGSSTTGDQPESEKSKENEKINTVPFHKLFTFADATDVALMIIGTIGALGNGVSMPLMAIIFGDLIDSFGQNQNSSDIVKVISKVSLKFVYLGVGSAVASFLQVSCWMVTGERQSGRIRRMYLKTILRQDVAFFDNETNTGEVVGRMSGDTVLIQDAMGEKVGKFIQLMSTFIGGFVIAFARGWLLTLVMLTSIPPLAIAGGITAVLIGKMASRGQSAYAKAAAVVEQTIGSIRTVASFTGEKQAISNYNKFLGAAYKSGIHEGIASGSVLTGSMSLGQTSPCLSAFAAGQAAAFKIIKENIAYGKDGATTEEIRAAAELANASKFVDKLPQGLDTMVGEHGTQLSVIHRGKMVEKGSHSELLQDPDGAYAQLIRLQDGFSADAKMMYEEASQVANDAVGSIRTVASFCAEEKMFLEFSLL